MRRICLGVAMVSCLTADALAAEGTVTMVPETWQPDRYRRLPVASASASTTLEGEQGKYAPANVADGHLKTKWVGSEAPSKDKPQWVRLDLAGDRQTVTGVAVFGERIDNDGVLDAEVQVAGPKPDEFRTAASIAQAGSARWLAMFEAVETSAVRLLVTRSSGPTPHTDIYEIQVLGPGMTPAGYHDYAEARLGEARQHHQSALVHARTIVPEPGQLPRPVGASLDGSTERIESAGKRLAAWESITPLQRDELVGRIEIVAARAKRLAERLDRTAKTWPDRRAALDTDRQAAKQSGTGARVSDHRAGNRIQLINDRVLVGLGAETGLLACQIEGLLPVDAE